MAADDLQAFAETERLGRLYTGGGVAVTADGAHVACGCEGALQLFASSTGRAALRVEAEADEFTAFALHPSNPSQLVTAARSRQLVAWALDLDGGRATAVRTWKAHRLPVGALAYDPTGTLVASAGADAVAMVFDVNRGHCTHVFRGHEGVVHRVLFHPDANVLQLVSSAADNTVRVWSLGESSCLAVLRGHVGLPAALAFSPDGRTLLTGGRDELVYLWRLSDYKQAGSIAALEPIHALLVVDADADASSSSTRRAAPAKAAAAPLRFLTAGDGGRLRLWDGVTRRCLSPAASSSAAAALPGLTQLMPCGDELLAVTEDHNLLFCDERTLAPRRCVVGNNDEITDLRFVPPRAPPPADGAADDGAAAAAAGRRVLVATNSEQLRLLELGALRCTLLSGHTDLVLAVDASADGKWLASASKDGTVRVWDAASGACVARGVGHVAAVGAVAFGSRSPVLLSGSKDKTAKLWDLRQLPPPAAADAAADADAAPASLPLLASELGHAKEINAVALAPNDRLCASGSQDKSIKLWALGERASELAVAGTLSGHKRAVWAVAFSPVDKVLASASGDMTIKVWSVTEKGCLRTLEGHTSSVLKLRFVRRGAQLVSSGSDGLVKLWSLRTSECVSTLDGHEDKVWALDAVEDGGGRCELLSGSGDSQLVRWADVSEERQRDASAAQAQELLAQQQLSNALRAREFGAAVRAALSLRQPRALRGAVDGVLAAGGGDDALRAAVAPLGDEDTKFCLEALRDWNTTATHSLSAQRLLHAILKGRTVAQLAALPGAKALVEAILPYSERHYERVDRLVQSAYFVEFTLRAMGMILPPADADADANGDADPPAAAADGADADAAEDDDDAEAAAAAAAELAAAKKARAAKGRRGSAASGGEGKKRRRSA